MSTFDRDVCLSNIYFLAKESGIKMGDLEARANVSAGYFSRLAKEGNTTSPGIEVVAAVADQLNVTIDTLISYKYDELSASERYIKDFLERLIERTSRFELLWDRDSLATLRSPAHDENGDPIHPLLEEYPDSESWHIGYNSQFFPNSGAYLSGDSFRLQIDTNATLYLMWVCLPGVDDLPFDDSDNEYGYELYLIKQDEINPLCCFRQPPFKETLIRLGTAADESSRRVKLNDSIRSSIDRFMKGESRFTLLEDETEDDLPF